MFYAIPDVQANNRTTPGGKVLLCDGPLPAGDPRAIPQVLETKGRYALEAIPAGWAIAGSTMRWDNGTFRVSFEHDGALHGRRFARYEDAVALFDKWTADA